MKSNDKTELVVSSGAGDVGFFGSLVKAVAPFNSKAEPVDKKAAFFDPDINLSQADQQKMRDMFDNVFLGIIAGHIKDMEGETAKGSSYRKRAESLEVYAKYIFVGESANGEEFIAGVEKFNAHDKSAFPDDLVDVRMKTAGEAYCLEQAVEQCGRERVIKALEDAVEFFENNPADFLGNTVDFVKAVEECEVYSPLILYKGLDVEHNVSLPKDISDIKAGWGALCALPEIIEHSINFKVKRDVINDIGTQLYSAHEGDDDHELCGEALDSIVRSGKIESILSEEDRRRLDPVKKWMDEALGVYIEEKFSRVIDAEFSVSTPEELLEDRRFD